MMTAVVTRETEGRKAQLGILVALAGVALVLTAIGIQGLLAFLVTQRAQEIGIRLALGADPGRVAGMIVGEASRWTAVGSVAGVLIAYAAARAMSALLFGLSPGDPATFGAGLGIVVLVALAGAIAPACRAVRISPLVALRSGAGTCNSTTSASFVNDTSAFDAANVDSASSSRTAAAVVSSTASSFSQP